MQMFISSEFPLKNLLETKTQPEAWEKCDNTKIHKKYTDVPNGEALALFISTGQLEIAMNEGSASSLMGLHLNDIIRIEFDD